MTCQITNNSGLEISGFEDMIQSLVLFSQDRFGFEKPPSLFLNSDSSNAENPLGKTAYYDPQSQEIHIYVDGRHPKDIMRSISHELIHHKQNLDGELDGNYYHGEGYAQKDDHMRKMEKQAYLNGNVCFRDWEDGYKQNETIYNEWRNKQMSLKEWKNNELFGLLANKWGFGKNLIKEAQDADGKSEDTLQKAIRLGWKINPSQGDEANYIIDLQTFIEAALKKDPNLSDESILDLFRRDPTYFDKPEPETSLEEEEFQFRTPGGESSDITMDNISEESEDEDYRHKKAAMDDFGRIAKLHKDLVYDTYKKHEDGLLGKEDDSERHDDAEYDDATHIDDLEKDAHYDAEHDKLQEMISNIVKEILNERK